MMPVNIFYGMYTGSKLVDISCWCSSY